MKKASCEVIDDEDGPGQSSIISTRARMYFEADIEDQKAVVTGIRFAETGAPAAPSARCQPRWRRRVLRVQGVPEPNATFFEFYTPINETQHRCFLCITRGLCHRG